MLDPKAKESPSSKLPFPWSKRENSTSGSNGSPRIITKAPPVPSHSVHTVQSYAKAQEKQNVTALSKTEHRYTGFKVTINKTQSKAKINAKCFFVVCFQNRSYESAVPNFSNVTFTLRNLLP